MMKRQPLLQALTALALLAAAGCESPTDPVRLSVNKVTLEAVGDVQQLTANVIGTTQLPEWESENPQVATVTRAGMVTAVGPGTTLVRARIGSQMAQGTVTVLPRVDVQLLSLSRGPDPTGVTTISMQLRNAGGRGFYRVEHWQMRETEDSDHRPVMRQLTDSEAPVGMDYMASISLPGMDDVDWVVVYSREPTTLEYRRTGCLRLDGGSECPAP